MNPRKLHCMQGVLHYHNTYQTHKTEGNWMYHKYFAKNLQREAALTDRKFPLKYLKPFKKGATIKDKRGVAVEGLERCSHRFEPKRPSTEKLCLSSSEWVHLEGD